MMMYGILTDDACSMRYACNSAGNIWAICAAVFGAVARISMPPKGGAMKVPNELNAWVNVSRLTPSSPAPATPRKD